MSKNKIFVGNLPFRTDKNGLREAFSSCGEIDDIHLVLDRETGQSRGFGFVTFKTAEGFQAALDMNGSDLDGRPLRVNEAEDKNKR